MITRMPKSWRQAFESDQGTLSSLDLMELVSLGKLRDFDSSGPTSSSSSSSADGPKDWPESLKAFVKMVKRLSINRTLDPDYSKFKDTLDIHLIPGMSPKKLHEVEILSGLMASYAKEHHIGSVIDLGAGQGYLSRVLAFQHQLCVLGVDSNTIQTCGAQTTQKRTEKLFVNKSKLKSTAKKATKQQRRNNEAATSASSAVAETSTQSDIGSGCPSSVSSPSLSSSTVATTDSTPCNRKAKSGDRRSRSSSPAATKNNGGNGVNSNGPTTTATTLTKETTGEAPCKKTKTKKPKAKRTISENTTPAQNIPCSGSSSSIASTDSTLAVPGQEAATTPSLSKTATTTANDPSLATTPGSNFQLQHITHHITAATLPTLLKEHFPKKPKEITHREETNNQTESEEKRLQSDDGEDERWTLCGLHACGDLTSNMIKLYLESSATCLFSVGCCYHWITERYDRDGKIVIDDGTHGFPLSKVFNKHKAHLGDHAKMIACQSPERWLEYQKETEDAIHGHYFRALLHKLMVERGLYPGPPAIAPVLGRMGKHRLKGFPHYVTTALNRLKLPADAITPEEAQAAYDLFLKQDLYRIGILWALRTMLGPLYEGMILLDRAMHLHETILGTDDENDEDCKSKEKKGSVQLVAGFDVVESPRNMILIALKD
ncbi:Methyltransferase-like protein 25 [Gryganskiella cystojenkinii]|nr:Methyltransferase-like protein 25 [Gryganskiella cystojenkinii]